MDATWSCGGRPIRSRRGSGTHRVLLQWPTRYPKSACLYMQGCGPPVPAPPRPMAPADLCRLAGFVSVYNHAIINVFTILPLTPPFPSPALRQEPVARPVRIILLLLVQAAILGWIYRVNWANQFAFVMGDLYDNTIEVAILEHWYNVLRGLAHWSRMNYFHPVQNTLGYNDGYLLYGLLYAPLRAVGADPFLAATLVHMAMKAAAFAFFYGFARTVLRLPFGYALAGAALFELGNGMAVHTMHAQLLTVALAPLCATLLYGAWQAFAARQPGRLLGFGAAFALTYGAWTMTAFYMLWFFSLLAAIVLVLLAAFHWRALGATLRQSDRATRVAALACLLILALSLAPFLVVYLPKAGETGMHRFALALGYALAPFDIINFGPGNYLYGGWLPALHAAIGFPVDFGENQAGTTPGLVVAFIAGLIYLWRTDRRGLASAIGLAALTLWVLALVLRGQTLWILVFHAVPGAKAIRVVARVLLLLPLPMASVALVALARATRGRPGLVHAIAGAACLFLVAEQLNRVHYTIIERAPVMARLARIGPPPAGCRAFVADDARQLAPGQHPVHYLYRHNVDAMLIAELINLPTINGVSTFYPPGWDLADPHLPDYPARSASYAQRHAIARLCRLDLVTMTWTQ